MTEKHLGVTRRNFLKIAGMGGGAVAAVSVMSLSAEAATKEAATQADVGPYTDPAGRPPRAWWVHTVDQPTVEIDWDKMQRFNERYDPKTNTGTVRGAGFAGYVGADTAKQIQAAGDAKVKQRTLDNEPGYTIKDISLYNAHSARPEQSFLGNQKIKTPTDRGVPNWSGTPDEAAKIIRAAMRHFGAGTVGFVELDDHTRKLIYSVDPDGKELVFADVDQPEETETQRIIPNRLQVCHRLDGPDVQRHAQTCADTAGRPNDVVNLRAKYLDSESTAGLPTRHWISGLRRVEHERFGHCSRFCGDGRSR